MLSKPPLNLRARVASPPRSNNASNSNYLSSTRDVVCCTENTVLANSPAQQKQTQYVHPSELPARSGTPSRIKLGVSPPRPPVGTPSISVKSSLNQSVSSPKNINVLQLSNQTSPSFRQGSISIHPSSNSSQATPNFVSSFRLQVPPVPMMDSQTHGLTRKVDFLTSRLTESEVNRQRLETQLNKTHQRYVERATLSQRERDLLLRECEKLKQVNNIQYQEICLLKQENSVITNRIKEVSAKLARQFAEAEEGMEDGSGKEDTHTSIMQATVSHEPQSEPENWELKYNNLKDKILSEIGQNILLKSNGTEDKDLTPQALLEQANATIEKHFHESNQKLSLTSFTLKRREQELEKVKSLLETQAQQCRDLQQKNLQLTRETYSYVQGLNQQIESLTKERDGLIDWKCNMEVLQKKIVPEYEAFQQEVAVLNQRLSEKEAQCTNVCKPRLENLQNQSQAQKQQLLEKIAGLEDSLRQAVRPCDKCKTMSQTIIQLNCQLEGRRPSYRDLLSNLIAQHPKI